MVGHLVASLCGTEHELHLFTDPGLPHKVSETFRAQCRIDAALCLVLCFGRQEPLLFRVLPGGI
jgi:hypothetical protein